MLTETPTIAHLSSVISQSTAPAFVLGAVAGFLSILTSRLERVADIARGLQAPGRPDPKGDAAALAIVTRRMDFLYGAIYFAVLSALTTAALLLVAFACAFFQVAHERGVAVLFSLALVLMMISLVHFVREVRVDMRTWTSTRRS